MQSRQDPSDPLAGHGGFVQQFQEMSMDQRPPRPDLTPPMHFAPYPPPMHSPYPTNYPSPYLMDGNYANYPYMPAQPMHPGFPPSTWSSPPMSPNQPYYRTHTRHQSFAEDPPLHYAPPSAYQGFGAKPGFRTANRRSWSGPGREPDRERKAYHPQAPANRSDWVMWVGNVPPGASHEELWVFFNQSVPTSGEAWRGPASIFLISRSSCAFVNLSCQEDLDLAVAFFNNKPLRPWDLRCPRLVCRVRKKDDDLRAGVGAQRGTGMHRDWIKSQKEQQEAATESAKVSADPTPATPLEVSKHQSSASYASTNSSFLTKNFPIRVFILKSATKAELEESVKTGTWRTQKHNEPILDQALRTASDVYLIFGANKAGEFFGYAKMTEHIDKEKFKNNSHSSKGSAPRPEQIKEEEEEDRQKRSSSDPPRPSLVLSPSQTRVAASSPGELTPGDEGPERDPKANTDPGRLKSEKYPELRSQTQGGYFNVTPPEIKPSEPGPVDVHGDGQVEGQEGKDGVVRKDTITEEEKHVDGEDLGRPFPIQWVKTGSLPFGRTRHLRNPWNADREVKVSRDGTEVEPTVGLQFIAEWDKLASARTITPPAGTPTYASVNRT